MQPVPSAHRISFRPLRRGDFGLLADWFAQPAVARWWNEPADPDSIESKYGPRVDGRATTSMWIVEVDGAAAGLAQHYGHADHPAHDAAVGIADAVGIDYLLSADFAGRGIGPSVLSELARMALELEPGSRRCVATPSQENRPSWRALERASFVRAGPCQPPGEPLAWAYVWEPASAPDAGVLDGGDTHDLGYREVDEDPDLDVLLATMDATAAWEATRRLRGWERSHLRLAPGQRLLDVGCGLGDAGLALGEALGPDGAVVGVDASAAMIAVARTRAEGAPCRSRFEVGDALSLAEPDASVDVVRCERTLQWVADPGRAVGELARVVRPGGLVSLLDTDWSTLRLHVGDEAVTRRVRDALRAERRRPSNIGGRLAEVARAAGLRPIAGTEATQRWEAWDPDRTPAPTGCFSMASLAADLVEAGQLEPDEREAFVSTVHDAAREGRFAMALTMYAVVAEAPRGRA